MTRYVSALMLLLTAACFDSQPEDLGTLCVRYAEFFCAACPGQGGACVPEYVDQCCSEDDLCGDASGIADSASWDACYDDLAAWTCEDWAQPTSPATCDAMFGG